MSQYDLLFKYISVGDSGVGKSCLLLRFTNQEYTSTETTIGIEFGSSIVPINNKRVKLQVWDTAGQESFRSISRAYYRGAVGCLLVYDITRRDSFMHVKNWLEDVMTHGHENIKIILVANKCDLESLRQVSQKEGKEFAEKHGMLYLETSARQGVGVDEAFTSLAQFIFTFYKLDRADISTDELKQMEAHGIKFGVQKPVLSVLPSSADHNDSDFIKKGAYGEVFKATDLEHNRVVALKRNLRGWNQRQAAVNEAKILPKLSTCKYVEKLYDAFRDHWYVYLAKEYIRGGDFRDFSRNFAVNKKQKKRIARQFAEAVKELHDHGYIHHDLHAGNVMMTFEPRTDLSTLGEDVVLLKLVDLGLSIRMKHSEDAAKDIKDFSGILHAEIFDEKERQQVYARLIKCKDMTCVLNDEYFKE